MCVCVCSVCVCVNKVDCNCETYRAITTHRTNVLQLQCKNQEETFMRCTYSYTVRIAMIEPFTFNAAIFKIRIKFKFYICPFPRQNTNHMKWNRQVAQPNNSFVLNHSNRSQSVAGPWSVTSVESCHSKLIFFVTSLDSS